MPFLDLGRHVLHVVALVGVGREGDGDAEEVEIAQPGRQGQDVHLPAGVVDVVLAGHLEAGEVEHIRQGGAIGGPTAMPDVKRPGGVGGDIFHLHPDPGFDAPAIGLAGSQHGTDDSGLGIRHQREVDEACAGHFGLGDQAGGRQLGQQQVGQLARIALEGLGELQRQVACEVSVTGLLRALQVDRRFRLLGRHAEKGGTEEVGKLGLGIGAHGEYCN